MQQSLLKNFLKFSFSWGKDSLSAAAAHNQGYYTKLLSYEPEYLQAYSEPAGSNVQDRT